VLLCVFDVFWPELGGFFLTNGALKSSVWALVYGSTGMD
jgi:hypothetical protein